MAVPRTGTYESFSLPPSASAREDSLLSKISSKISSVVCSILNRVFGNTTEAHSEKVYRKEAYTPARWKQIQTHYHSLPHQFRTESRKAENGEQDPRVAFEKIFAHGKNYFPRLESLLN